ncbi:heme-binding protein 2-like [Leucoraja erinacea]|uniref:heme-binding protein 2-like n=1 Tax=Leucoraja erinaceus TaxID=7782 RepID=UPI0024569139|nr:heme-binding protein 2-like [Leucoraja erinacea]
MLPVTLLLAPLLFLGGSAQWGRTPVCTGATECFSYVTLCRDTEYESRAYEPSHWIGTQVLPAERRYRAINRLREYFNRKNRPGILIERTSPTLTMYVNVNGVPRETAVFFYLPRRFLSNPPIPRDELVYLSNSPAQSMFVRSAGSIFFNLKRASQELFEDLLRQREIFMQDRFYLAEYHRPLSILGRRNEIWFQALGPVRCGSRFGSGQSTA